MFSLSKRQTSCSYGCTLNPGPTTRAASIQTCLWVHADPITEEEISVFTQNDNRPGQLSRRGQGFRARDPSITSSGLSRSCSLPTHESGLKGVKCKDRWEKTPRSEPSAPICRRERPGGARHRTNKKIQFSWLSALTSDRWLRYLCSHRLFTEQFRIKQEADGQSVFSGDTFKLPRPSNTGETGQVLRHSTWTLITKVAQH